MKVAIYSRKSKITGKGESIKNQIDLCREHMQSHFNVNEFIVYEDEGFSGGNSDRPQYKKMLQDAKAGRFSALICYRLDRISRSISDFSETIEILNSLDISFISLREQFDTSTPMGRAMMYIASVFAQLERETIAERIKDNMLSLARTGRWLGGNSPTGYKSKAVEYYDDSLNKKTIYKLIQVPDEMNTVKKLFRQYLKLGSLCQVELWAMQENLRTRNGKLFDITGIRSILTNMVYVSGDKKIFDYCKKLNMDIASNISEFNGDFGLMVYNKNIIKRGQSNKLRPTSEWVVSIGKHKGVISSSDFIRVQENIEKNKINAPKTIKSNIYLLGPILKCEHCGSSMRTTYGRKRKDGTRLYYYKCILKEKSRSSCCNVSNLNGKNADLLVFDQLKNFRISYPHLHNLLKGERKEILFLNHLNKDNKLEIEKDIINYLSMISKLTESLSLTRDSKSSQYIIRQIEDLDTKIVSCQKQLDDIKKESQLKESERQDMKLIQNIVVDFPSSLDVLNLSEKRDIVDKLIKSILWDGRSLKVFIK